MEWLSPREPLRIEAESRRADIRQGDIIALFGGIGFEADLPGWPALVSSFLLQANLALLYRIV